MNTMEKQYCDVGNHDVEEIVIGCAICSKRICSAHTGNQDEVIGSFASCTDPDHIARVAEMNRQQWQSVRKRSSLE